MDYTIEKDGGGTRVLLANGDRLLIKTVIGNIEPTGETGPDGRPVYRAEVQAAWFVTPKAPSAPGKH